MEMDEGKANRYDQDRKVQRMVMRQEAGLLGTAIVADDIRNHHAGAQEHALPKRKRGQAPGDEVDRHEGQHAGKEARKMPQADQKPFGRQRDLEAFVIDVMYEEQDQERR